MTAQASHDKFVIATKASPSQENGLTPAGIRAQLDLSLSSMQTKKVAVL
jgi:aryl-alcohol dehydrogenase-like predicted oxidoreductase